MIRFFHTADIHFGVENYGKIDQKTGMHSRFFDFVTSFESCIDKAVEEKVDFFLFCGDADKTANPTPTQQKQMLRLLFKLQKANIPVVIVVGNHDHPLSFGKAHSLDVFNTIPLDGMYVISKPKILKLETKSGPVQIVGMPWPMRQNIVTKKEHRFKDGKELAEYISKKVGLIIAELAKKLDEKIPSVLAGHMTVSTGIFSGSEKSAVFGSDPLFLSSQLAIKPFDYVALGHLHRHQDLNKKGKIPVVYSGSVERIDFGERKENIGFCDVKLDSSKQWQERCSYEFIELKIRKMIQIEVEIKAGKNQTNQIVEQINKSDVKDAIVKIIYHIGEGIDDKVDLYAVQRACSCASHIASIIPIRKVVMHERRIKLNVAMDFESIVKKYLDMKYIDTKHQDAKDNPEIDLESVKKRAMQLYNQLHVNQLHKEESVDTPLIKSNKKEKANQL